MDGRGRGHQAGRGVRARAPVFGGEPEELAKLDELKAWLSLHNTAVMAVLFLVFGVVLISKGLGLLTA